MVSRYSGTFPTEKLAAKVYDQKNILCHGLGAKTNFDYTNGDLIKILTDDSTFTICDTLYMYYDTGCTKEK